MAEEVLLHLELPCTPLAPRVVRASLSSLNGIGACVADLALISSELVSNAVMHSGGSNQDLLDVSLARCERGYRVSVVDPGHSCTSAEPAPPRPVGCGGLGMKIVETLAARWGQCRGSGYRVWAEVSA
jgi:anti-sigma regulatory factor (Ser/Thr protein kinase)